MHYTCITHTMSCVFIKIMLFLCALFSQHYGLCEEMLSFALGRLTTLTGSGAEIERVKAVLHQELLVTDLQKHADRQKYVACKFYSKQQLT